MSDAPLPSVKAPSEAGADKNAGDRVAEDDKAVDGEADGGGGGLLDVAKDVAEDLLADDNTAQETLESRTAVLEVLCCSSVSPPNNSDLQKRTPFYLSF